MTAGPTVSIFVDYGSPLAVRVAEELWSALYPAALRAGYEKATARWSGLGNPKEGSGGESSGPRLYLFVVGQDRPEAVEEVGERLSDPPPDGCGMVVAVPEAQSPLAGPLLYQGVERLTGAGARAGNVLPALLSASSAAEREAYSRRLLELLRKV